MTTVPDGIDTNASTTLYDTATLVAAAAVIEQAARIITTRATQAGERLWYTAAPDTPDTPTTDHPAVSDDPYRPGGLHVLIDADDGDPVIGALIAQAQDHPALTPDQAHGHPHHIARHAATWSPPIALAVAGWLRHVAADLRTFTANANPDVGNDLRLIPRYTGHAHSLALAIVNHAPPRVSTM